MNELFDEIRAGMGLRLSEVAKRVPSARRSGSVSESTVWRWAVHGSKALNGELVKLEAVRVGGQLLTSEKALDRFMRALTFAGAAPSAESDECQQRAIDAANARLAAVGA